MDTTTKCQHFVVIGGLALLLIILACVAFLSPSTYNEVHPVTRTVTYPTGWYDANGYTHTFPTTSRNSNTRSTRYSRYSDSTSRYSTRSSNSRRDDDSNEDLSGRNDRVDDNRDDRRNDVDDTKTDDYRRNDAAHDKNSHRDDRTAAVAAMYPAEAHAGHNRTKRAVMGMDGSTGKRNNMMQMDGRNRPMGQIGIKRDMKRPPHKQMVFNGKIGGLVPGQIYAVCMHQFGDMRNGCDQMGPAFNNKSMGASRMKRAAEWSTEEENILDRFKRDNKMSKKGQDKVRAYLDAHNGTLMGFAQADAHGNCDVSMSVPDQHQEACSTCGGTTGRGVTMRPVMSAPEKVIAASKDPKDLPDKRAGNRHKRESDNYKHKNGQSSKMGAKKDQDVYQHKKMATKGQDASQHKKLAAKDQDMYQHKKMRQQGDQYHHNSQNGQKMTKKNQDMRHPMFDDGKMMNKMNRMAKDGSLNGALMYGHMDAPCACGVFGHAKMDKKM